MKGWSTSSIIFFSVLMCKTWSLSIISFFFKIFIAKISSLSFFLTKKTFPYAPLPTSLIIKKSSTFSFCEKGLSYSEKLFGSSLSMSIFELEHELEDLVYKGLLKFRFYGLKFGLIYTIITSSIIQMSNKFLFTSLIYFRINFFFDKILIKL